LNKANRNELCPCGSGKKNKKCCGATAAPTVSRGVLLALAPVALLAGIGVYAAFSGSSEPRSASAAPAAEQTAPASTAPQTAAGGASSGSAQPGPAPAGQVWSPEHGHFHDAAAANAPSPIQIDMNPGNAAVKTDGGAIRIDGQALAAAAGEMRLPGQPDGPAPEGKVWSTEHAHWHDKPKLQETIHLGTLNYPSEPVAAPTPAPAGKVWSPEHGHWHDAPPR
jgi:hypothetical protein